MITSNVVCYGLSMQCGLILERWNSLRQILVSEIHRVCQNYAQSLEEDSEILIRHGFKSVGICALTNRKIAYKGV